MLEPDLKTLLGGQHETPQVFCPCNYCKTVRKLKDSRTYTMRRLEALVNSGVNVYEDETGIELSAMLIGLEEMLKAMDRVTRDPEPGELRIVRCKDGWEWIFIFEDKGYHSRDLGKSHEPAPSFLTSEAAIKEGQAFAQRILTASIISLSETEKLFSSNDQVFTVGAHVKKRGDCN